MALPRTLLLAVGLGLLPASVALAQHIQLTPDAPVSALRHEWNAAVVNRDTARIGALLAEGTLFVSRSVRLEGRDAVTAIFDRLFATRRELTFTLTTAGLFPERPSSNDSVVSEYGRWRESWAASDGRAVQVGTYYDVWVRTPEGWRIALHAFATTGCSGSATVCQRTGG